MDRFEGLVLRRIAGDYFPLPPEDTLDERGAADDEPGGEDPPQDDDTPGPEDDDDR